MRKYLIFTITVVSFLALALYVNAQPGGPGGMGNQEPPIEGGFEWID